MIKIISVMEWETYFDIIAEVDGRNQKLILDKNKYNTKKKIKKEFEKFKDTSVDRQDLIDK